MELVYIPTKANETEAVKARKKYDWETPPAPIPETEIVETLEADVAVVGGGIAGMAVGARCTEKGMSVMVVEKFKGLVARGAQIACLDSKAMRESGVQIDKQQFARDWMRICGSRVNEDLLWLYINKSEEAVQWMEDLGKGEAELRLYGGYYKGPDFTEYAGTHIFMKKEGSTKYKNSGALLMCEILQDVILTAGNKIIRNMRVEQLEKKDGCVVAFFAKGEDGKYRRYKGNKAVVLATGDIGGDPEMLDKYCPIGLTPKRNGYTPFGLNTGDGHKMALWAGAAFEDASWALSLHLMSYALYTFFFLHVNRLGKRFMNEDTWAQAKAVRCLMQPGGDDWAFSVFDSKWFEEVRERAPLAGGQFTDPFVCLYGQKWDESNSIRQTIERYVEDGIGFRADTIKELAVLMDVPVDALIGTVGRYNELASLGKDPDYGKRSELLTTIDKPPYYALKWGRRC